MGRGFDCKEKLDARKDESGTTGQGNVLLWNQRGGKKKTDKVGGGTATAQHERRGGYLVAPATFQTKPSEKGLGLQG